MGEGQQVERESEPPADDRQTADEYKLHWKRSGGETGREKRREKGKRMTDHKNRDRSKEREKGKTRLPNSRTEKQAKGKRKKE